MTARRIKAPSIDGGVLVDPSPSAVAGQIAANADQLSGWDHDFQGRRAKWLRSAVRQEVVALARSFLVRHGLGDSSLGADALGRTDCPLIVTGHQPELFHPGVWIKNFAAASFAAANGGVGLNLIVDNDVPKSTSIAVPSVNQQGIRLTRIEFDRWGGDAPFEDSPVLEEERFSTFADRVHAVIGNAIPNPLLNSFWPRALRRRHEAQTHGMRFSLARARSKRLGELPILSSR